MTQSTIDVPPPPPPLPPVEKAAIPITAPSFSSVVLQQPPPAAKSNQDTRRKSGIIAFGGGGKGVSQGGQGASSTKSIVNATAVTYKANGEYLLTRGKMLDAIIETALNSDFGGEARALISTDVYSSSGKIVLIPKGSRVIGKYDKNTGSPLGYIAVKWFRIDLPNGYTIDLGEAISTDNLGKAGTPGSIDRKILEQINNSLLTSAISMAVAKGLDAISPPTQTTTTSAASTSSISSLYQTELNLLGPNAAAATVPNVQTACINVQNSTLQIESAAAYQQIMGQCGNNGSLVTQANYSQVGQLILNTLNAAANGSTFTSTSSNLQTASQNAYTDFGNTLENIAKSDNFNVTVTVPQGTAIKIYINQDFVFPRKAVNGVGIIE
jgi:type IV secretion system protein VirB10